MKAFRFRSPVKSRRKNKGNVNRDKINQVCLQFLDSNRDIQHSLKMIRREMGIWKRVNHPNIVPFLGIAYGFGREGSASLVSLWMTNGTLHAFLTDYDDHLTEVYRLQLVCRGGSLPYVRRILTCVCSSIAA